ncbi:radical SAM protein [candidate division CSSED10-310 bacterium]|uniref:Radical SAM protein n=1 Tax=candidate division CSSED10-310 bacterium TaxID=2855610 RepID=A0ABV6YR21_UNCC1
MRILLINPPYSRLKGVGQAPYFPLGLGCLATAIPPEFGTVRILNLENPAPHEKSFPIDKETVYRFRSQSYAAYKEALRNQGHNAWNELKAVLREFKPELIGITSLTVSVEAVCKITTLIKEWHKNVPVVWGGVHPTFETEACLKEPGVDFVIRGEGEISFRELCRQLTFSEPDFQAVPGLSLVVNQKVVHTKAPDLISNLDQFFPPRRDVDFFSERYSPVAWGSIMASRGCPWQCTFCSSPRFWQRKLRYREPIHVFNEIKTIVSQGLTRHFTFWDDSFTANSRQVTEMCQLIIDHGLKITWKTATRTDLINDDLLRKMRQAGCIQLQIGIETGSPSMATRLKKDVDPHKSIEAVEKIKKYGIGSGAFFMAGFPDETKKDLEDTYRLMRNLDTDEIVLNVFDPMPGSEYYQEMKQQHLFLEPIDWKNFPLWPDQYFAHAMDEQEFNAQLEAMSSWIFSHNNRLDKKWHKNKLEIVFLLRYDRKFLFRKVASFLKSSFFTMFHLLAFRSFLTKRSVILIKWLFWRSGFLFLRFIPLKVLYYSGDVIGTIFSNLDRRRRMLIEEELSILLPQKGQSDLQEQALVSFKNFVKEQLEAFHYPNFTPRKRDQFIELHGAQNLTKFETNGKGAIFLTAHFGAHLLPILALEKQGVEVFQLGTPPAAWEEMVGKSVTFLEKDIFSIRHKLEKALPATFISLDSSLRPVFRILENNGVIIIAFDGRGGKKWRSKKFLGRLLQISTGPYQLAYSSGAPIIPTFTVRRDNVNHIYLHPPICLNKSLPKDEETDRAMDEFLALFHDYVIQYPGHYGWLLQAARVRAAHDSYPLLLELSDSADSLNNRSQQQ